MYLICMYVMSLMCCLEMMVIMSQREWISDIDNGITKFVLIPIPTVQPPLPWIPWIPNIHVQQGEGVLSV